MTSQKIGRKVQSKLFCHQKFFGPPNSKIHDFNLQRHTPPKGSFGGGGWIRRPYNCNVPCAEWLYFAPQLYIYALKLEKHYICLQNVFFVSKIKMKDVVLYKKDYKNHGINSYFFFQFLYYI